MWEIFLQGHIRSTTGALINQNISYGLREKRRKKRVHLSLQVTKLIRIFDTSFQFYIHLMIGHFFKVFVK